MSTIDCERTVDEQVAERYLRHELAEHEQLEYEGHFFECSRCAEELTRLLAVRQALTERRAVPDEAPTLRPWWRANWLSLAATALVASLLAVVLLRAGKQPERVARELAAPLAQTAPIAVAPVRPPVPAPQAPAAVQSPTEPVPRPEPVDITQALRRLARFEPPPYRPTVLRGVTDEASARFRDGMTAYAAGDYRKSADQLEEATRLDPSRPDIAFFLGIARMLSGETGAGKAAFQRTVDMGDSPFLGEAHFFLGKAYLGEPDLAEARRQFDLAARVEGGRQREARQVLEELDRLAGH